MVKVEETIKELEAEFEFFKLMVIGKLNDKELDGECLERIIEKVYWLGHFTGRCRERTYRKVNK